MNSINVVFLGTSASLPTKERNHTSLLVNVNDEVCLVDCGEGTQRQLRQADISPTRINKIFITHWHGDHTLGLPGLLQTLQLSQYQKELEIYGPKGTKANVDKIFSIYGKLDLKIKIIEISKAKLEFKNYLVESQAMKHSSDTLAYAFKIKDKLRINKAKLKKLNLPNTELIAELTKGKNVIIKGKKLSYKSLTYMEKGKKLTIILDTLPNVNAIALAKDSDILIAESSFSGEDEEKAAEHMHLTAKQAAEIAKKSKSQQLVLTHISQRYEKETEKLSKEAQAIFRKTSIAKDLDRVSI